MRDHQRRARIYLPTSDARLIALDAQTSKICPGFGDNGTVNPWANMPNQKGGFYYSTSPPTVVNDLIIIGGSVNDNYDVKSPSGVIRAYDASTGALDWAWDSGNPDRTTPLAPGETYTANSPNSWSVFSADPELGLVYIPLGNATPDQFGGNRSPAVERFSSSVVALDIASGAVRWVRQTVHHDLWDMDVPAQPVLVELTTSQGAVPALVQATKQGDMTRKAHHGSIKRGGAYSVYFPYVWTFCSQPGNKPLKLLARPRGIEPRFSP